jgi:predicted dehydrogenase
MKQIAIGVIGMGWMGQAHSRSYLQVPLRFPEAGIRPRLVACSDTVAARAENARTLLGFERSTTDWREVIADPEIEVVNICTPNNEHVEIVRAAAAAGKHIFCEKPVGRTPEETAEVEAAARAAGVISGVGYNYRWAPMVQHAHRLLSSGALGKLQHWHGRFFSMYGANPLGLLSWRFDSEIAGSGALGDLLSHVVDMTHVMAGPIRRVNAHKHQYIFERPLPVPGKGTHYGAGHPGDPTGPVTNEDFVAALVEFESGAVGMIEASRALVGPKSQFAFEASASGGAFAWDFERMNELSLYQPDADGGHDGYVRVVSGERYPNHSAFVPGDGNGIGYEDLKVIEGYQFLSSVAEGQPHAPGFAEALAVANVHAAIVRSWDSGRWEDVVSLRR